MTFQESITSKYPVLFDKNKDGIPVIRSGCYCPVGWETLVDDTLHAINNYVSYCTKSAKINTDFYWKYDNLWMPIYNWLFKAFETDDIPFKDRIFHPKKKDFTWRTVTKEEQEKEKLKLGYKLRQYLKKVDAWIVDGRHRYTSVPVKAVQVDQIKEKFGGLRLYITGGDEFIQGIIGFAEFKSSQTCMFTGEKGERGNIRGWIVTATKEKLEELQKQSE